MSSLRILHFNLDGLHRGDRAIMSSSLKDARSDDEGEDGDDDDDDDDDDSASRKKKRS